MQKVVLQKDQKNGRMICISTLNAMPYFFLNIFPL